VGCTCLSPGHDSVPPQIENLRGPHDRVCLLELPPPGHRHAFDAAGALRVVATGQMPEPPSWADTAEGREEAVAHLENDVASVEDFILARSRLSSNPIH